MEPSLSPWLQPVATGRKSPRRENLFFGRLAEKADGRPGRAGAACLIMPAGRSVRSPTTNEGGVVHEEERGRSCRVAATIVVGAASSASQSTFNASVLSAASGPSPFAPGCEGVPQSGTLYENAEVEPRVAVDPSNPAHIAGVFTAGRTVARTGCSPRRASTGGLAGRGRLRASASARAVTSRTAATFNARPTRG
jgi:hypothetical protein